MERIFHGTETACVKAWRSGNAGKPGIINRSTKCGQVDPEAGRVQS